MLVLWIIDVEGKYGLRWQKRSATPLFELEGSSLKLVVSSCVRKRCRKMELKDEPGRFATSFALPAQSKMSPPLRRFLGEKR